MLLKWIGFFVGYVTVLVTGGSPERFMNLCAVKRRDVWDFQSVPEGLLVNVRISEYKNLRLAARRARVHLHIVSKHGLPFFIQRHRHRYGLAVGIAVFFLLLQVLCGRVWQIQVQGNTSMETRDIIGILAQSGIREGIKTNAFDWASVRQEVILNHPEISWMSFNPVGTVLHVDISEATPKPDIIDASQPCDLKATCDGRIVDMQVQMGKPIVQKGDAVVKGDLLVSGAVEYSDGCTVFRHASAIIKAETSHTVSFEIPLQQVRQQRTGKQTVRRVLRCFNGAIPLYIGSVKEPYEKETSEASLTIAGTKLPFGIQTAVFYHTTPITVTLTQEEAIAEAAEKTDAYVAETLKEAEITGITYDHSVKNDVVTVTAKISCIENISFEEKLLIF